LKSQETNSKKQTKGVIAIPPAGGEAIPMESKIIFLLKPLTRLGGSSP